MVSTYNPKTERRILNEERIKTAISEVRVLNLQYASSSNLFGSKYMLVKNLQPSKINCSQNGLSLAYDYADYLGCKYPESW